MQIFLALILCVLLLNGSDEPYKLGEHLYKETCLSCHGADGSGNVKVTFIVNPRDLRKTILTKEQSYLIIRDGAHFAGARADIMPSFKSTFNEKELRSLAYYVNKKFDPKAQERVNELYNASEPVPKEKKAQMLKVGKKIFNRNCSWCHGVDGHGDGEATRNPEMSIFPYNLVTSILNEEQMFLYTKYGGKHWGTHKTDMPSWSSKYDDYTLKSVSRYIFEVLRKEQKQ
jgi:mono/diheme cytochrome c family protein